MKRDEIWLGFCLCAILFFSGLFDPAIEKVTAQILNTPFYPRVVSFVHSEREVFQSWEKTSTLFHRRFFTRKGPSNISAGVIPSKKVPLREMASRG